MPRYIDADALEKEMLFWSDTYGYGGLTKDNIREIIKSSPTADVVEVVRCRECKHKAEGQGYCYKHGIWLHRMTFCSVGERRKGDRLVMPPADGSTIKVDGERRENG